MSDYVARVEAFLDAREASGEARRGTITVAHGDGSRPGERPGMYRRPLTDADLHQLLADAKKLRERAETAERELAEMRERIGNLREEWGYRWGNGDLEQRAEGYDTEADARIGAHHSDTIMRRHVTDWEDVPAKDAGKDGDRG